MWRDVVTRDRTRTYMRGEPDPGHGCSAASAVILIWRADRVIFTIQAQETIAYMRLSVYHNQSSVNFIMI
jgi:hypothetical protein